MERFFVLGAFATYFMGLSMLAVGSPWDGAAVLVVWWVVILVYLGWDTFRDGQ